jgi:hypothetical protein
MSVGRPRHSAGFAVRFVARAMTARRRRPMIRSMPLDAAAAARKLKLGAARSPAIVGASDEDRAAFSGVHGGPIPTTLAGRHDWILLYAQDRASLEQELAAVAAALDSPGTLWIAYPKGSSKRQTDLTRDQGWDSLRQVDLMWLSLISIDDTWSAFGLRHYHPGEARQTFR